MTLLNDPRPISAETHDKITRTNVANLYSL